MFSFNPDRPGIEFDCRSFHCLVGRRTDPYLSTPYRVGLFSARCCSRLQSVQSVRSCSRGASINAVAFPSPVRVVRSCRWREWLRCYLAISLLADKELASPVRPSSAWMTDGCIESMTGAHLDRLFSSQVYASKHAFLYRFSIP